LDCISSVRPSPDRYVIAVHGSPQHVGIFHASGGSTSFTPDQLKAIVTSAGNYKNGTGIALNSCNTGRYENGFAQQLSRAYGTPVAAPNDFVWGYNRNVGPPVGVANSTAYVDRPGAPPPVYDHNRPGQWNVWNSGTLPTPPMGTAATNTQPLPPRPPSTTQPPTAQPSNNPLPFQQPPANPPQPPSANTTQPLPQAPSSSGQSNGE
jgi:hypothetical protein